MRGEIFRNLVDEDNRTRFATVRKIIDFDFGRFRFDDVTATRYFGVKTKHVYTHVRAFCHNHFKEEKFKNNDRFTSKFILQRGENNKQTSCIAI